MYWAMRGSITLLYVALLVTATANTTLSAAWSIKKCGTGGESLAGDLSA